MQQQPGTQRVMAAAETVPGSGSATPPPVQAPPRAEGECEYFRFGNCLKGEHCQYTHIEANK
eukprot:11100787-Alexandrium_andersonii.AAC.1